MIRDGKRGARQPTGIPFERIKKSPATEAAVAGYMRLAHTCLKSSGHLYSNLTDDILGYQIVNSTLILPALNATSPLCAGFLCCGSANLCGANAAKC